MWINRPNVQRSATKIASHSAGAITIGYGRPRWPTAKRVKPIDSHAMPRM